MVIPDSAELHELSHGALPPKLLVSNDGISGRRGVCVLGVAAVPESTLSVNNKLYRHK